MVSQRCEFRINLKKDETQHSFSLYILPPNPHACPTCHSVTPFAKHTFRRPNYIIKYVLFHNLNILQRCNVGQFNFRLVQFPASETVGSISLNILHIVWNDVHHIIKHDLLHLPDNFLAFGQIKFGNLLVVAEGMRLTQETIHEGGLAMVNMGDDGDVSEVGSFGLHIIPFSPHLVLRTPLSRWERGRGEGFTHKDPRQGSRGFSPERSPVCWGVVEGSACGWYFISG